MFDQLEIYNPLENETEIDGMATWLDNGIFFDPRITINGNKKLEQFVNDITKEIDLSKHHKRELIKKFIGCLIGNLTKSHKLELPIAIHRSRNEFKIGKKYGLKHYSYSISEFVLCEFKRLDLLEKKAGYYNRTTNRGKITRVWPSQKLNKIFEELSNDGIEIIYQDENTIRFNDPLKIKVNELSRTVILKGKNVNKNIRERSKKRKIKEVPIDYLPTEKIARQINFLKRYNAMMDESEILYLIDDDFLNRIKEKRSGKIKKENGKKIFEQLKNLLEIISSNSSSEAVKKEIYKLLIQLQQSTHLQITNPLLRKRQGKYILYDRLDGKMHRIYHRGDFKKGGRFYGATYQILNKLNRKKIVINGMETIEVDYGGFHLRMLYHLAGLAFDGCPYNLFNGNDELRNLMKLVSLVCINAKSEGLAKNGIRQILYKDEKLKEIAEKNNMSDAALLATFKNFHSRIKEKFFRDNGVELMYLDSMIAEKILKYFYNKKVTCLCIHDSFIIDCQYEQELKKIMIDVYKEVLKTNFNPVLK